MSRPVREHVTNTGVVEGLALKLNIILCKLLQRQRDERAARSAIWDAAGVALLLSRERFTVRARHARLVDQRMEGAPG